MTTTLWRSPSGRLHHQRHCSGGAGRRNRKVTVPDDQLAPLEYGGMGGKLCACAIGVRDKARARLNPEGTP
jgi:hypothetical protein